MNLDDESLLSGYLDDELDPADRLVVEWAVESNPPLAEDLRSLAIARDAVSSLGRTTVPRDLSASVVANLNAARRRSRFRSLARPLRYVGAASTVVGMAASLLFAMILVHRSTHDLPNPAVADAHAPDSHSPDRTHPIPDPVPVPVPSTVSVPKVGIARVSANPRPRPMAPGKRQARPDDARDRDVRLQVAALMDQPRVIRALIVTDVIDASDQVQSLIAQDARKNPEFGRITIYQGIVVDPSQPDEADVFPVVMDEPGSGPFLDRLLKRFPKMVVERDINPEFLTQLPEVGQVALLQGTRAAPLVSPPLGIDKLINANRGHHQPDQFDSRLVRIDGDPLEGDGLDRPALGAVPRPGLTSVGVRKPDAGPDRPRGLAPKADNAVTILVWVTRPTPH